jgi:hypothetical protein
MKLALVAATALAALLVGLPEAMADSPPPPEPKLICPEVYQPVCGVKDGKRVDYSNKCFAAADQASNVTAGKCSPDR